MGASTSTNQYYNISGSNNTLSAEVTSVPSTTVDTAASIPIQAGGLNPAYLTDELKIFLDLHKLYVTEMHLSKNYTMSFDEFVGITLKNGPAEMGFFSDMVDNGLGLIKKKGPAMLQAGLSAMNMVSKSGILASNIINNENENVSPNESLLELAKTLKPLADKLLKYMQGVKFNKDDTIGYPMGCNDEKIETPSLEGSTKDQLNMSNIVGNKMDIPLNDVLDLTGKLSTIGLNDKVEEVTNNEDLNTATGGTDIIDVNPTQSTIEEIAKALPEDKKAAAAQLAGDAGLINGGVTTMLDGKTKTFKFNKKYNMNAALDAIMSQPTDNGLSSNDINRQIGKYFERFMGDYDREKGIIRSENLSAEDIEDSMYFENTLFEACTPVYLNKDLYKSNKLVVGMNMGFSTQMAAANSKPVRVHGIDERGWTFHNWMRDYDTHMTMTMTVRGSRQTPGVIVMYGRPNEKKILTFVHAVPTPSGGYWIFNFHKINISPFSDYTDTDVDFIFALADDPESQMEAADNVSIEILHTRFINTMIVNDRSRISYVYDNRAVYDPLFSMVNSIDITTPVTNCPNDIANRWLKLAMKYTVIIPYVDVYYLQSKVGFDALVMYVMKWKNPLAEQQLTREVAAAKILALLKNIPGMIFYNPDSVLNFLPKDRVAMFVFKVLSFARFIRAKMIKHGTGPNLLKHAIAAIKYNESLGMNPEALAHIAGYVPANTTLERTIRR